MSVTLRPTGRLLIRVYEEEPLPPQVLSARTSGREKPVRNVLFEVKPYHVMIRRVRQATDSGVSPRSLMVQDRYIPNEWFPATVHLGDGGPAPLHPYQFPGEALPVLPSGHVPTC
jgi:hypothetical protein